MSDIKEYVVESRNKEVETTMIQLIEELNSEGYTVEFGKIGKRTTYALLFTKDHEEEIVGYTFLKDLNFYKENVGKLKALQQALARKKISDEKK